MNAIKIVTIMVNMAVLVNSKTNRFEVVVLVVVLVRSISSTFSGLKAIFVTVLFPSVGTARRRQTAQLLTICDNVSSRQVTQG